LGFLFGPESLVPPDFEKLQMGIEGMDRFAKSLECFHGFTGFGILLKGFVEILKLVEYVGPPGVSGDDLQENLFRSLVEPCPKIDASEIDQQFVVLRVTDQIETDTDCLRVIAALFKGFGQKQQRFGHPLLEGDLLLFQAAGSRVKFIEKRVEAPAQTFFPVDAPGMGYQSDRHSNKDNQDNAEDGIMITGQKTIQKPLPIRYRKIL
jgi:hypothetical protein